MADNHLPCGVAPHIVEALRCIETGVRVEVRQSAWIMGQPPVYVVRDANGRQKWAVTPDYARVLYHEAVKRAQCA